MDRTFQMGTAPLPFGYLNPGLFSRYLQTYMAATTQTPDTSNITASLVQLLRGRSYEEIRARMYDNSFGTHWWSACKTELDIRNSERLATSLVENSRVSAKIGNSAEHMEKLTETLLQVTADVADVVRGVRESSRRVELATYAIVGVAIAQLFYVGFLVMGKR